MSGRQISDQDVIRTRALDERALANALREHWLVFDGINPRCTCGQWSLIPERDTYAKGPHLFAFSKHLAAVALAALEDPK